MSRKEKGMEGKRIPGNYSVREAQESTEKGFDIYSDEWGTIANVFTGHEGDRGTADLFAAAPELLAALGACQLQLLQSNNNTEYAQEAVEMANYAISKARGEQP